MSNTTFERIKTNVEVQIEDIMMAENINRSESITYLKDCYTSGDASAWNIDSLMFVLNSMI